MEYDTRLAVNLQPNDIILLGPRRVKAKVLTNTLCEVVVNGKSRSIQVLKVQPMRDGKKDKPIEIVGHWQDEFALWKPKPKPRRTAFLKKLASWLNMEVKIS